MSGFVKSAFLLAILLAPAAARAASAEDATELARQFCAARLADDEAAVRKLLTPSLLDAIGEAEARNKLIADATPDEKPPLGDGIPYQAFPDMAPECAAGELGEIGGNTTVMVRYAFPDQPSANWTDRLVLAEEAGGTLLVDDILYQQFPTDSEIYGLRRTLTEAFDQ